VYCQQQLVVVAARQCGGDRVLAVAAEPLAGLRGDRQRVGVDDRADAARLRHLMNGVGQAVAQVHGGRRDAVPAGQQAHADARLGEKIPRCAEVLGRAPFGSERLEHREPGGGAADGAGDVEVIAFARAAARQDLPSLDGAADGDVEDERAG
jgi:hypothetical protein